jgi:glycosyltransferase involved in cell wall biosynthesis
MPIHCKKNSRVHAPAPALRVVHVMEATEGGTRRWLENIVTGLDPSRVEQACICSVRRDAYFMNTVDAFRARGINVWVVDMARSISPVADLRAVVQIQRILKDCSFDIVHAHSSKAGLLARIAARLAGVRTVVYTPHAYAFLAGGAKGWLYRAGEMLLRFCTDHVVAVSQSEAALSRQLGHSPKRITVIPNGVDVGKFRVLNKPSDVEVPVLLSVMSFRKQKDHHTLLQAYSMLRQKGIRFRVVLCGDGPLLEDARKLSVELDLGKEVEFAGWAGDVPERLADADVFLFSTHYEGLPYALLEAMASGKAVVASDVAGVREIIENAQDGFLVPESNPKAMADAMMALLSDVGFRQAIGKAARKKVEEQYSLESQIENLTLFYESMRKEYHDIA